MRRRYPRFVIMSTLLIAITFGGWLANSTTTMDPDLYVTLKKNITLFKRIYEEISFRYVDEVDPEAFIKAGIEGMTSRLDPYTNFVEKEENESLRSVTEGKYGGVGMNISKRSMAITIEDPPYDGTPAAKAGIREGDQLIEIEGSKTQNLSLGEVADLLRGKPGTKVNIKIKRFGEPGLLNFSLVRDMITVQDVTYSNVQDGDIGYVRLARFSRFAADQLSEAIYDLKTRGIKGLVLDLRSNPGGLLSSAVSVADLFLPKGDLIVYTKGRAESANKKYYSENDPLLPDTPIVVLVDNSSASASEIVAGAIQDLDRGLILGERTYGKGLVQTVVPFSRNTALRLTTAKYYVPSGRLIQNLSRLHRDAHIFSNEDTELSADSTETSSSKEYRTKSGRLVFGGGGIKPDIEFESEQPSNFEIALNRQSMFFNFAVSYSSKMREIPDRFEVNPQIVNDFREYLIENDFGFLLEGEEEIDQLDEITKENHFGSDIENRLDGMRESLMQIKKEQFDSHLSMIRKNIRKEIAAKIEGSKGQVEASLHGDPVYETAVEVLTNPNEYAMKLGK